MDNTNLLFTKAQRFGFPHRRSARPAPNDTTAYDDVELWRGSPRLPVWGIGIFISECAMFTTRGRRMDLGKLELINSWSWLALCKS